MEGNGIMSERNKKRNDIVCSYMVSSCRNKCRNTLRALWHWIIIQCSYMFLHSYIVFSLKRGCV